MGNDALQTLIALVDDTKKPIAEQLVTELGFMEDVLAELRENVRERGATEHFVNGSQEFERQTPALQAYNTTITKYATLQRQFLELLPDGAEGFEDELDAFLGA